MAELPKNGTGASPSQGQGTEGGVDDDDGYELGILVLATLVHFDRGRSGLRALCRPDPLTARSPARAGQAPGRTDGLHGPDVRQAGRDAVPVLVPVLRAVRGIHRLLLRALHPGRA